LPANYPHPENDNPWNISLLRFLLAVPMRTAIASTILDVFVYTYELLLCNKTHFKTMGCPLKIWVKVADKNAIKSKKKDHLNPEGGLAVCDVVPALPANKKGNCF